MRLRPVRAATGSEMFIGEIAFSLAFLCSGIRLNILLNVQSLAFIYFSISFIQNTFLRLLALLLLRCCPPLRSMTCARFWPGAVTRRSDVRRHRGVCGYRL